MNDEPRDYLHEAFMIAGDQSMLITEKEHLKAIIKLLEDVIDESTRQIIKK